MCRLAIEKSRRRTGYKVLALKNGKWYSTFTGQLIEPGIVPNIPEYCTALAYGWATSHSSRPSHASLWYIPSFNGYTAAFKSIIDLQMALSIHAIKTDYKLCIVKISFIGKVYKGEYGDYPIIAGDTIKSIKYVKPF